MKRSPEKVGGDVFRVETWLPAPFLMVVFLASGAATACGAQSGRPLPSCEWCGTGEAPADLGPAVTIAGEDEAGRRIVIDGVVYQSDGETPASDVTLYLYHTNDAGVYEKLGNETGNGRRHGHLRGWLRTEVEGRYEIRTIWPGNYPGREAAAHIHVTVQEPGGTPEYWIPSFNFAGDPYLEVDREAPNVLHMTEGDEGTWYGGRDIVLPEDPSR